MTTYISLLRGVNMTGHNTVKMADLAELYRELGLDEPETFIQSGNVIFNADMKMRADDIAVSVEAAIFKKYAYDIPVMIRTVEEMKKIIASNPYLGEVNFDPARMAVIFLRESVNEEQVSKVADVDYPPDKFLVSEREIYTFCPNGFGRTKIYTNFFEARMKVRGTARNWKTITTLMELAGNRK